MKRWSLRILTLLSALLFVLSAALWILSHLRRDFLFVRIPHGIDAQRRHLRIDADSYTGQLNITWLVWPEPLFRQVRASNAVMGRYFYHATFPTAGAGYWQGGHPTFWTRIGFYYYYDPTLTSIYFPYWFVCGLSAPLPAVWLYRHRKGRRWAIRGLCPFCGYDMRATPQKCPECGKSALAAA